MPAVGGVRNTLKRAVPERWRPAVGGIYLRVRYLNNQAKIKRHAENAFWSHLKESEGLWNAHHERVFTDAFGLSPEWYRGKRMLDIGCGPSGSLEWATMAAERVGLDPLADDYRTLGIDRHAMRYVNAPSERIPFPDGHFDVISTFNSLDHVDDLDQTIGEIKRVARPGATLLLLVEVNHPATVTEPISLTWEITERFAPVFQATQRRRYPLDPKSIYAPILSNNELPSTAADSAPAVLLARLERV